MPAPLQYNKAMATIPATQLKIVIPKTSTVSPRLWEWAYLKDHSDKSDNLSTESHQRETKECIYSFFFFVSPAPLGVNHEECMLNWHCLAGGDREEPSDEYHLDTRDTR